MLLENADLCKPLRMVKYSTTKYPRKTDKTGDGKADENARRRIKTEAIESYFKSCEERNREPTAPGLCIALGISRDELNTRADTDGEIRNALLYISDCLEQRRDTMAKFLLRQSIYGAYGEAPDEKAGANPVRVKLLLEEDPDEL